MPLNTDATLAASGDLRLARGRAKVLAREDREMRAALVAVREAKKLTQAEIAARMGVSPQAVSKLERYDADPKLSTLRRYANAIGAIVEHRVTEDRGQSEWMATKANWPESFKLPLRSVQPTLIKATTVLQSEWSEEKRSNFALAS